MDMVNKYYNLATDFYVSAWQGGAGCSFIWGEARDRVGQRPFSFTARAQGLLFLQVLMLCGWHRRSGHGMVNPWGPAQHELALACKRDA